MQISFADAKPDLICPACGRRGRKPLVLTASSGRGIWNLHGCRACGSRFFHPMPSVDYTNHTESTLSVRSYVELNASIEAIVASLRPVMTDDRPGSLLDVGCGFGFAIDFARRLADWHVQGVEPSSYGRLGASQLKVPIDHRPLTADTDFGREYDIVYSSEVIEHVADPAEFVRLLKRHLTPDGIMIVGTPDAALIRPETGGSELNAILSAGSHTVLLSQPALKSILVAAGFRHVLFRKVGASMIAYASTQRFRLVDRPDLPALVKNYYRAALQGLDPDQPAGLGIRFRLYRELVHAGQWDEAEILHDGLDFPIPDDLDAIRTYQEFGDRLPIYAPALAFSRGMYLLEGRQQPNEAVRWFQAAHDLCRVKLRVAPHAAVVEENLVWTALFHAGVAARKAGRTNIATDVVARFRGSDQGVMPAVPPPLLARLGELVER